MKLCHTLLTCIPMLYNKVNEILCSPKFSIIILIQKSWFSRYVTLNHLHDGNYEETNANLIYLVRLARLLIRREFTFSCSIGDGAEWC